MTTTEKISRPEDFKYVYGRFPQEFVYTMGDTLESFFNTLKSKGKFTGTYCPKCGITYVPPVSFCERCFSRLKEPVNVGSKGVVESFTVSYFDVDGAPLVDPEVWALVKLDGASTTLFHKLLCKPEQAKIGMRVKARFKPKPRRTGSMADIEGFIKA